MKKILILFAAIVFSLIPFAQSINYYADIEVTVDSEGFTTVKGITNYENLIVKDSTKLTSKENGFWLLNVTTSEVFADYIYKATLPKGASINYIKSKGQFRIENNDGVFSIIGFTENEPLEIVIQYELKKIKETNWQLFSVLALLLILMIYLEFRFRKGYWKKKKQKKNKINSDKPNVEPITKYDLSKITDRQKRIMKFLIENKKPVTQIKIGKELNIPKASVSRNIVSLELKGFVERESIGVSTIVRLKKQE